MKLHTLKPAEGSKKNRRRVGRGEGSGYGDTAARGHKGAKSRSGYSRKDGFEGGQMPLMRRLPKFGFKNPFRVEYTEISLGRLQQIAEKYPDQKEITKDFLVENSLIKRKHQPIKVLAGGELTTALKVTADKFSKSAKEAVAKAGGEAIELGAQSAPKSEAAVEEPKVEEAPAKEEPAQEETPSDNEA